MTKRHQHKRISPNDNGWTPNPYTSEPGAHARHVIATNNVVEADGRTREFYLHATKGFQSMRS